MGSHRYIRVGSLLSALVIACSTGGLVSACAAVDIPAVAEEPARVEPMPGSARSRVILTEEAAKRVGIETATIVASSDGAQQQIPLSAVLYDENGHTWTYTNPEPLTYVPVELIIQGIVGEDALFHSGPSAGTPVVTIGGAELLGAEYGVPGE